uniref:Uncharacterized protein n=1 Tax=Kwoniella dejecticola CBS 10117 TaxID=1296121 RepID=A0A1A6A5I4_9TREE|nr:uncharacterized protein I303_04649 [Kwoniella dejecticola CBS 10117]OBR85314.1 hypothetical protein I303_04649 [Kwoniella dejecticola CBS 10117]
MRSTFSTISCFFLTLSSLLHSASSKYVDLVSSSDLELAQRIDDFATENGDDIYHFIALTTQDNIIVQLRYEDDSMAFSGIFSPTPNLQDHLASVQQAIYQTTVSAGLESYSNDAASLESLQTYRYNETLFLEGQSDFYPSSPEDLQKRRYTRTTTPEESIEVWTILQQRRAMCYAGLYFLLVHGWELSVAEILRMSIEAQQS